MANDSLAKGTPFDIGGLTAYQAGSVVSRTIVDRPAGSVTSFAFDEGQLLTEHSSPRAVVVTLLSGTMDFDLSGATHHLTPGDVLYMAPGEVHALRATSPCHMQLVMVDVDA